MFVIVRHGNTFESGTPPRRIGARTDIPLTAKGLEQAHALGAHFAERNIRFDRILVSPLTRTQQTAQAIMEAQSRPPEPEAAEFLREIDYGPDENALEDEVIARIGMPALAAWEARAEAPVGWIVYAEERIAAWQSLFASEETRDQTLLLVASNGSARFALMADPGLAEAAENLTSLKLPTGGFGVIARNDTDALILSEWGARP